MNIGVLGWWHHDNQGDSTLLGHMTRALAPHCVVPIELPFEINGDSLRRLNLLDFVILGGGGLFQRAPVEPFDRFEEWQDELQTPIGVTGLGIDQILPQHRPAVVALADRARFFYVRDRASQELAGHPKVQVAPDLSFLYPLRAASVSPTSAPSRLCGVNLRRLGNTQADLWIDQWLETIHALPMRLRGIPFTTNAYQEVQTLRHLDAECVEAFSPALYEGLHMMIGMAFHSVLFAVQAGVPVIGVVYAPKVRRFMAQIGLEDYCLELDEWQKLPNVVECVGSHRSELVEHLAATTRRLEAEARDIMAGIVQEIERAPAHNGSRSSVSVVVLGSGSDEANQATVASCLDQTHQGVEVVFSGDGDSLSRSGIADNGRLSTVATGPAENTADRLSRAMECSAGEYVSWVVAGDTLARDTIACLADCLDSNAGCDLSYASYYTVDDQGYIVHAPPSHPIDKLFRANVVGPCFLYRRRLGQIVGAFNANTPLVDYDYWLRARQVGKFTLLRVRLLYTRRGNPRQRDVQAERLARRQWRATGPWLSRQVWRLLDTDFAERNVVQPLLKGLQGAAGLLKPRRRRAQPTTGQAEQETQP